MKEMLEWRRERQKRVELCLEDEFYDILDADDYYPEPKSESVKTDDKKNTSSSEAL